MPTVLLSESTSTADLIPDPCIECKLQVEDDGAALQCDLCLLWIHKACSPLKETEYVQVTKRTSFVCDACKSSLRDPFVYANHYLSMERKVKHLHKTARELKAEIAHLTEITGLEGGEPPTYSGRSLLSKDQQSTIFEILKCAVCLEIPKGRPNLQVKTCEMGHHFCMSCHKKLKSCAICRGKLFHGRNFAVEELLSKLGPALGVAKTPLPEPLPTPNIEPGFFFCPHNCGTDVTAMYMLPHIRKSHANKLVDSIRSNPYTGRLEWMFRVVYKQNGVTTLSLQVSDMGLMSVKIQFKDGSIRGSVLHLCRGPTSSVFKYRMTLFHSNLDYSLNGSLVLGYDAPPDAPAFNVPAALLPPLETTLDFYVYIWRKDKEEDLSMSEFPMKTFVPEEPIVFHSDRNARRNRKRNKRKARVNARYAKVAKYIPLTPLSPTSE